MPKTIAEQYLHQPDFTDRAARYLIEQLLADEQFVISAEAAEMYLGFEKTLKEKKAFDAFRKSLLDLRARPAQQLELARNWLFAYLEEAGVDDYPEVINETALLLLTGDFARERVRHQPTRMTLQGLHGEHSQLEDGTYQLDFNDFFRRIESFEVQKNRNSRTSGG